MARRATSSLNLASLSANPASASARVERGEVSTETRCGLAVWYALARPIENVQLRKGVSRVNKNNLAKVWDGVKEELDNRRMLDFNTKKNSGQPRSQYQRFGIFCVPQSRRHDRGDG